MANPLIGWDLIPEPIRIGTVNIQGSVETGEPLVACDDTGACIKSSGSIESLILVDTSSSPQTVFISGKAAANGSKTIVKDETGDATTNNITVTTQIADSFRTRRVPDGLVSNRLEAIAVVGTNVYAGSNEGGVSYSADGGETFTRGITVESGDLPSNNIFDVDVVGVNVYIATTKGLAISTDDGDTFTTRNVDLQPNGIDDVFSVHIVGSTIYAATATGLWISTDNGVTFPTNRTTSDGLGDNVVIDVFVEGVNVFCATQGGLSISTDSGANFTNRTTVEGLGSNVATAVFAVGANVYAGTTGGLAKSTDTGANFTNRTTTDGLGDNWVRSIFVDGTNVYAGTTVDLSVSTDGGVVYTNRTKASNNLAGILTTKVIKVGDNIYATTAEADGGLSISRAAAKTIDNAASVSITVDDGVSRVIGGNDNLFTY